MPRLSAGFSACGFPAVRDLLFPDGPGRRGKGGILKILIALGSQFLILSFFFFQFCCKLILLSAHFRDLIVCGIPLRLCLHAPLIKTGILCLKGAYPSFVLSLHVIRAFKPLLTGIELFLMESVQFFPQGFYLLLKTAAFLRMFLLHSRILLPGLK
jgi:hypothetical protein